MDILLYDTKKEKIIKITDNIVEELYDNLLMVPTIKQLKTYDKIKLDNPEEYIIKLRKYISKLDYKLPLFDYATKNIYLIAYDDIYNKITLEDYRFPNKTIIELLESTLNEINNLKSDSVWIHTYIKKLTKNLNFLSNFNMEILKDTFIEVFINTNPTSKEITSCIKPSYLPYQSYQSPYYNKSELISMALNLNLITTPDKKPWTYSSSELKAICNKLTEYEINTKTLLENQLYILYNNAKSYIQFFSLFGSYYFNNYLRNKNSNKDIVFDNHIQNMLKIIEKSPKLDSNYEVYRFIESDDYLNDIKVGSIHNEDSFISTTRNPFYPKDNLFGFILIKIILKKNTKGIALLIESYSNYQQEQEILLPPSKLKLISIDNDFKYYHWNKLAEKRIVKKYIFEYIEPLSYDIHFYTNRYNILEQEIPFIDFSKQEYVGRTPQEKTINFFVSIPKINLKRTFKTQIGSTIYDIDAYFLTQNKVYSKFFFLQREDSSNQNLGDEIYLLIQDKTNAQFNLIIEIRNIISVNYYHRFSGLNSIIADDDLIQWISYLAKSLSIQDVIIHGNYSSYVNIVEDIIKKNSSNDILEEFKIIQNINNPDVNILNLYTADISTFCTDLLEYITNSIKRFNNKSYISRKIPLHMIERLKQIKFKNLYKLSSNTEYIILYKIYKKQQKEISIFDFYKIIHYEYPYLINRLQNLIILTYPKDIQNPWHFYYVLKPFEYLYTNRLISYIPTTNTNNLEELIKNINIDVSFIYENKFRQILNK